MVELIGSIRLGVKCKHCGTDNFVDLSRLIAAKERNAGVNLQCDGCPKTTQFIPETPEYGLGWDSAPHYVVNDVEIPLGKWWAATLRPQPAGGALYVDGAKIDDKCGIGF